MMPGWKALRADRLTRGRMASCTAVANLVANPRLRLK